MEQKQREFMRLRKEIIESINNSTLNAAMCEESLMNLLEYLRRMNSVHDNRYNIEYDIPPQAQHNKPRAPQYMQNQMPANTQPPIFGQTLMPPVMGNQVNPLVAQAQNVPFLYHNQQA